MNEPHSDKFVPLKVAASATRNRGEFQVTVVSQAEHSQPFQAMGIKPAIAAPVHSPACEPKVSLQREGDRITSIHIECTCGRVIELACDY